MPSLSKPLPTRWQLRVCMCGVVRSWGPPPQSAHNQLGSEDPLFALSDVCLDVAAFVTAPRTCEQA